MDRLEKRGSGILLLHDIHQRTATILPKLLRELKARGYKVVHMVPADGATLVAAAPAPAAPPAEAQGWPGEGVGAAGSRNESGSDADRIKRSGHKRVGSKGGHDESGPDGNRFKGSFPASRAEGQASERSRGKGAGR